MFFDRYGIHIQAFGDVFLWTFYHFPILISTKLFKQLDTQHVYIKIISKILLSEKIQNAHFPKNKNVMEAPFQQIRKFPNFQILRYE